MRRPLTFKLYIAGVMAIGVACIVFVLETRTRAAVEGAPLLLWVLLGCVVVAELLPINVIVRSQEGELMTSTAFAFATMIAFGTGAAVPALALASLIGDLARRKPLHRSMFNVGQYGIALTATGLVMEAVTSVPHAPLHAFSGDDLPTLLLCGMFFFVVNTALVATVIALASGYPIWRYFASDFILQSSTAGFALGLSPLMVVVGQFSVGALPLMALPLVAIHRNTRQAVLSQHQALHDALTGLPNRVLFHDRVRQAIESSRRHQTTSAVMVMDLDHFKEINDTLGHYHGDRLLQLVGQRLVSALRGEDTVARMGGDEFAVLLPDAGDQGAALEVARKLLDALHRSFEIDGLTLEVGASVGVACFPDHGDDGETLLQRADIAMYVAKADHSGAQPYETEQDQHSVQRLALAGELRRAIERDELVLHYQPKVDVASGRVTGAEALCRWHHPTLGVVMPDEFVPMAEHTGLITPLTRRVLDLALAQVAHWRDAGYRMSIAVNLSARSFLDSQLLEDIPELLEHWAVDPALLELEITESMIVGDPERARGVLERLNAIGITLAIDDFGTGYSSLAYLKQLPVDAIKIDKSFVLQMRDSVSDDTIVRSIVDLAHNLGMRAVAEGVEDQATMDRLMVLGCDVAQGYHVSRPLPPGAFREWLLTYPAVLPWQADLADLPVRAA